MSRGRWATFVTVATIHRVEPGRLLEWRALDRRKHLEGSRLVESMAAARARFTWAVDIRLLGPWRLLTPLVGVVFRQRTEADLRRLKGALEPRRDGSPA